MKKDASCLRSTLATSAAFLGLGLAAALTSAGAAEPTYDNYIDFAAAGASTSGDSASRQKILHRSDGGSGGIEGFHYETDFNKTTSLTLDGHAIAGDNDYLFDFKLAKEDVGFLALGYKSFRSWFDGHGGYFAPNGLSFQLYDNELHVDRSDLWFAGRLNTPGDTRLDFRYDFTTRKGLKDSTSWGDTNATAGFGTRAIVPAYLRINEHRHIFTARLSKDAEPTSWAIDGRVEKTSIDNDREMQRAPGEKSNRYVTQKDASDSDLFMVHGFIERQFTEQLSMSTAVAHYDIDTNISGSRITGLSYDPVFDPVYASRQNHDEGFYDLRGDATMRQTIANLNVMYQPTATWTIVPSLRAEKTTWGISDEYVETSVDANLAMAQDENRGESNRNLRSLTECLDARYTGIANWVFTFDSQWLQSYGTLAEDLIALETGVDTLFRTTDYRQDEQKYTATAHWYAKPGLSFTGQYYWKGRQNSFNDTRDSTALTGGDRYPAYIAKQDFETNDFNLRMTWSPVAKVRLVTRYDFQDSTVRTRAAGLTFIESSDMTSHIISETATWNPLTRWYVQLSGNLVYDQMTTPASDLTGKAGGLVLNSDNNYVSSSVTTGYVLNDQMDLVGNYDYYHANNYVDNSNLSLPYGATATTQVIGLTLNRRINARTSYTIRYAYVDSDDVTSGGINSFRAHTVYGTVKYRF